MKDIFLLLLVKKQYFASWALNMRQKIIMRIQFLVLFTQAAKFNLLRQCSSVHKSEIRKNKLYQKFWPVFLRGKFPDQTNGFMPIPNHYIIPRWKKYCFPRKKYDLILILISFTNHYSKVYVSLWPNNLLTSQFSSIQL